MKAEVNVKRHLSTKYKKTKHIRLEAKENENKIVMKKIEIKK